MGAWHFGRRPPDRQRAGATGAEKPRRPVAIPGGDPHQSPARPRHARGDREIERPHRSDAGRCRGKISRLRLATLTVDEGDEVTAGQRVATISSPETEAQLRAAQAQVLKAKQALAEAVALIAQRKSDLDFTRTDYDRGKMLIEHGNIPQQVVDQRRNKFEAAEAAHVSANAQRDEAESAIKAAEADVERLQSVLTDLVLVSPRSGRVQYRLARAGEVVAAGQRVLTILDLKDVYMTVYLPADDAGKLTLGDEARVIADPIPQYVIPATISFVATDAQFTPKSVETAEERQKLMFRVKLQGDPKVLDKYHRFVKTGVRGLGFVRTDPKIAWPDELVVKLPQ